jgi:hypothetical protein
VDHRLATVCTCSTISLAGFSSCRTNVRSGVKNGRTQAEQKTSALPQQADVATALAFGSYGPIPDGRVTAPGMLKR